MSYPFAAFWLDGINGKTTGAVTIGVTDPNRRFYPTAVIFEVTAATSITVAATVSVGSNGATNNDILAAAVLTGLTALNKTISPVLTTAFTSVAPGGTIGINITVGATATTCTLKVGVVGFYG